MRLSGGKPPAGKGVGSVDSLLILCGSDFLSVYYIL